MNRRLIRVGMADLAVTHNPGVLMTVGLGSCIGIVVYDHRTRIGGMAHVMLPRRQNSRAQENPAKFADSAVPLMLERMQEMGASRQRIEAKLVGGAQMFSTGGEGSELLRIGHKNAEAAEEALQRAGIRVVARDIGGTHGRTVEFDTTTGELRVKTIAHGERLL